MKIKLESDLARQHAETQKLKVAAPAIQEIIDELNNLNLVKARTIADVYDLVEGGSEWVKKKIESAIESQPVRVLGIEIRTSKKQLLNSLELPDMSRLDELCEAARERNYQYQVNHFSFENGKIEVGALEIEKIKESCTLYARNKNQEKWHSTALKLIDTLNELNSLALPTFNYKHLGGEYGEPGAILKRLIYFDGEKFKIKDGFYSEYNYQMSIAANLSNSKQLA